MTKTAGVASNGFKKRKGASGESSVISVFSVTILGAALLVVWVLDGLFATPGDIVVWGSFRGEIRGEVFCGD